jgi:hypothetical protein
MHGGVLPLRFDSPPTRQDIKAISQDVAVKLL